MPKNVVYRQLKRRPKSGKRCRLVSSPQPISSGTNQGSLEAIESVRKRLLDKRRKAQRRIFSGLLCFVVAPVLANTGIYYNKSSGYSQVETVIQIQNPTETPAASQGFFSSFAPPTIGEAIAAEETVHSSNIMEMLIKNPMTPKNWLNIPTIDSVSDLLLSNEKIRLARYHDLVQASYDPTEQVIRMTVASQDLELSRHLSSVLIDVIRRTVNENAQATRIQLMDETRIALEEAETVYAGSIETVQDLESEIGVIDPQLETEIMYGMVNQLQADKLEYEIQLRNLHVGPNRNNAVSTNLKTKIEVLDEAIAELRIGMTAIEGELNTLSGARLLLEAAHFRKDLASQRLHEASVRFSNAELKAGQHQKYVTIAAPPNEVSLSRAWVTLYIFGKTLVIALFTFIFVRLTIDVLRPTY